jgi:predicted enzyme related to lactoylglutathione lyase
VGSLVVFSVDVSRLARFYELVLDVRRQGEYSGDVRLVGGGEEILIHAVPAAVAESVSISTPPAPRQDAPIKPVFDVGSLDAALEVVAAAGGVATATTFTFEGLTRHDVLDPDGNVIQLRGPSA